MRWSIALLSGGITLVAAYVTLPRWTGDGYQTEYLAGGAIDDLELVYRYQPHTIFRNYYASNSRGYFCVDASRQRPFWHRAHPYFVQYRLNSLGYRERELPVSGDPRVVRIACLGDSYTFGQGVHVEDTFPAVLERILNNTEHGANARQFETLNFGVKGYAAQELRNVYRIDARRFEPHIVIVTLCLNDNEDTRLMWEHYRAVKQGDSRRADSLWRQVRKRAGEVGYFDVAEALAALHKVIVEDGAKMIVAVFEHWDHEDWETLAATTLPRMRSLGVNALRLRQPLIDANVFGRRSFVDSSFRVRDAHPNELAHAVMAQVLAGAVTTDVLPTLTKQSLSD